MVRERVRSLAWGVTASAAALVLIAPVVAMVLGSFRAPGGPPPRGIELLPSPMSLDAYRAAFELAPLGRALANSAVIALAFVPIAVIVSSWAGLAIALARGRRRTGLTVLVLALFMVPAAALWIARFVMLEAAGLVGTPWPLIAPALVGGTPFGVLLYVFAFRRIPRDVLDAAALEGAGPLRLWRRVAMPLARGTTAAVAMLAFVQTWTSLIDPLLYLNAESSFTAPLALRYLQELGPTNWPVLLAGSTIVALPPIAVFAASQRAFLRPERGLGWLAR